VIENGMIQSRTSALQRMFGACAPMMRTATSSAPPLSLATTTVSPPRPFVPRRSSGTLKMSGAETTLSGVMPPVPTSVVYRPPAIIFVPTGPSVKPTSVRMSSRSTVTPVAAPSTLMPCHRKSFPATSRAVRVAAVPSAIAAWTGFSSESVAM